MTHNEALHVLGVDRSSVRADSFEEAQKIFERKIREAYLAKLKESHPDLGGTHEETLRVQEAYEVLSRVKVQRPERKIPTDADAARRMNEILHRMYGNRIHIYPEGTNTGSATEILFNGIKIY